jgi:hypothetical protein
MTPNERMSLIWRTLPNYSEALALEVSEEFLTAACGISAAYPPL